MPLPTTLEPWEDRLLDLARRIRTEVRGAVVRAAGAGGLETLSRAVGRGEGDETFALDAISERVVGEWLVEVAAEGPLSLLTEETGWRHLGPGPDGAVVELDGFDHGGPRIGCDPVDGTRNLMHDLRSAWAVLGLAGPGAGQPRLSEVQLGVVAELPDSRASRARIFSARAGSGCGLIEDDLDSSEPESSVRKIRVDADDRVDGGYFSFFCFHPEGRPAIARLALDFFRRLERGHGADLARCLDDQYISSAGQLVPIASGTYRVAVDARAELGARSGSSMQAVKPYDICGAVLCAREAGAVVLDLQGQPLDGPLDARTSLGFVAFANEASRARLWPELEASLSAWSPDGGS